MLNRKKFIELFSALCEMFGKTPSKAYIDLYYSALADLTPEIFDNAIRNVIKNRKYTKMPLPAEIREAALGDVEHRAILAVEQIFEAIKKYGGYASVDFDDNVIKHVINQYPGGWVKLCELTYEELHFVRKDLIKRYMAFDFIRENLNEIKYLPGRFEMENDIKALSHSSQKPVAIDKSIIGILLENKEFKQIEKGINND